MYKTLKSNLPGAVVPQTQPVPGRESEMIKSESGGYVFEVSNWEKLNRFLILGSETAYYATAQDLTKQATVAVNACIEQDGKRAVETIAQISESGRAVKNDPALYALALAASAKNEATRKLAIDALPRAARTATHLFHFMAFVGQLRKSSRMLRTGVAKWYTSKSQDQLAYQVVKYRQRDGWTHQDAIRLSHPKPQTHNQEAIFRWVMKPEDTGENPLPALIQDFAQLQACKTVDEALKILTGNPRLPWEAIPPDLTTDPRIWDILLPNMGQTALIRNLSRMTSYGLLTNTSKATKTVLDKLADQTWLKAGRVHPFSLFVAQRTYQQGHGVKGKLNWTPINKIIDALEDAFYLTFQNVNPVNKPLLLAVDVSGSMSAGEIVGLPGICPRDAAAAMTLITVATEPDYELIGFDQAVYPNLGITSKTRLDDAVRKLAISSNGTDCSLPVKYALASKTNFDGLVMYTDNQSWGGAKHTYQAINDYRQKKNPNLRAVAVAAVEYNATILDPQDSKSLNVYGMDTAAPAVIADFIADRWQAGNQAQTQEEE